MNVLVNSLAVVYLDMKLIIIGSKLAQAPNDIEVSQVHTTAGTRGPKKANARKQDKREKNKTH